MEHSTRESEMEGTRQIRRRTEIRAIILLLQDASVGVSCQWGLPVSLWGGLGRGCQKAEGNRYILRDKMETVNEGGGR